MCRLLDLVILRFLRMFLRLCLFVLLVIGFILWNVFVLFICIILFMLLSCENGVYFVVIYNILFFFKEFLVLMKCEIYLGMKLCGLEEIKIFILFVFGLFLCLVFLVSFWFKVCMEVEEK